MRILLFVVLVLNFLFEGWLSVMMVPLPFSGGEFDVQTQQWAVHYGFAALVMALTIVLFWLYGNTSSSLAMGLGVLCLFHLGIMTSSLAAYSHGGMLGPAVVHGILFVAFTVLFILRDKCLPTVAATDD